MVNFLFWNLKQKPLVEIVARLVIRYRVDVLMLAESQIQIEDLSPFLRQVGFPEYFDVSSSNCSKIQLFTKFDRAFINHTSETDRYTIRHLKIPNKLQILLVIAHLPSRLHENIESLRDKVIGFSEHIKRIENEEKHQRTIVIGDLNLDPFDSAIVKARGLHAVMSQEISKRRSRTVDAEKFPFFYNPMWNFLGDQTNGPPGTYYYDKSQAITYFWHIFDQVLLRPDLLDRFDFSNLRIIESDGPYSFLDNGRPNKLFSDHLPVFFSLAL